MRIYYFFYRLIMRIAHKFNWHYAPPVYPEGDTMLRCKWCGFSAVIKKRGYKPVLETSDETKDGLEAIRSLAESQIDLPPDFKKILLDNLDTLYDTEKLK